MWREQFTYEWRSCLPKAAAPGEDYAAQKWSSEGKFVYLEMRWQQAGNSPTFVMQKGLGP